MLSISEITVKPLSLIPSMNLEYLHTRAAISSPSPYEMCTLILPVSADNFPFAVLGLAFFTYAEHRTDIRFDPFAEKLTLSSNGYSLDNEADVIKALQPDTAMSLDLLPQTLLSNNYDVMQEQLKSFDDHLALRSFFSGEDITAKDWVVWGALRGSVKALGLSKNGKFPHLYRWFSFIESLDSTVEALAKLAKARRNLLKATSDSHAASFDLYLMDAVQGQVVTRFPPEPSGYLHIGHIKAAVLNDYFARRYEGKLIIRFDDTNPLKEKEEFEQAILADLEDLGIHGDVTSHSSDYFLQLYSFAVQLIKEGNAYVDDTDKSTMKHERWNGLVSANRDRSIEDNLALFEAMKAGTKTGLRCCLRAKISIDNPNKAMRDPVIYRCIDSMHAQTGDTWKIYPTYDFACPIIDSLEGVTHALRSNEYRDRNAQYYWMLDKLSLRPVHVWDFSRLNFIYAPLSKRVLRECLDRGLASGWDDPRFPTFRGIRRRGMTIGALRRFMLAQGPSQNQVLLEWDGIWSLNKKIIDPIAPRFSVVVQEKSVHVSVRGVNGPELKMVPKYKKIAEGGSRQIVISNSIVIEQEDAKQLNVGDEIVLMNWGAASIISVHKDQSDFVTDVVVELKADADMKHSRKITWVPNPKLPCDLKGVSRPTVAMALLDYDFLITKPKLKKGDDISRWANPRSEFCVFAWGEAGVSALRAGSIVQFERKGYFVVDSDSDLSSGGSMRCIRVPNGKERTPGFKS